MKSELLKSKWILGQRTINGYYLVDKQSQTQYLSNLRDVTRIVFRVKFITLTVLFLNEKIENKWIMNLN